MAVVVSKLPDVLTKPTPLPLPFVPAGPREARSLRFQTRQTTPSITFVEA